MEEKDKEKVEEREGEGGKGGNGGEGGRAIEELIIRREMKYQNNENN